MENLAIFALTVVAVISAMGVFHPKFDDTLTQRVALSGVSMGAVAFAWRLYQGASITGAETCLIVALALYCLGTLVKYSRVKNETPAKEMTGHAFIGESVTTARFLADLPVVDPQNWLKETDPAQRVNDINQRGYEQAVARERARLYD